MHPKIVVAVGSNVSHPGTATPYKVRHGAFISFRKRFVHTGFFSGIVDIWLRLLRFWAGGLQSFLLLLQLVFFRLVVPPFYFILLILLQCCLIYSAAITSCWLPALYWL
jgi:hypothetical protein